MTDLDRATLDRLLPATPGSADWSDVMGRFRVHRSRRRRRLTVLAATALVVAVGTASAFSAVRDFVLDRGFVGLPPEGATPSAPESGELELSYWVTSPGHGTPGWVYASSRAWVYADGRLIWLREGADTPDAASRSFSGFLEQRLTPEGVELMRSEIASTGLFDHDRTLVSDLATAINRVELRNGGRFVRVQMHHECAFGPPPCNATTATPAQVNAFEQLAARLNDPAAWLPASAWADGKIRAYVPSRFAVCFDSFGAPSASHSPSQLLAAPPATVEDVLSTRYERTQFFSAHPSYCASVTSEEARTLDKALDDAGLEGGTTDKVVRYVFRVPGPIREPAQIFFEPYLPHGEVDCSVCW